MIVVPNRSGDSAVELCSLHKHYIQKDYSVSELSLNVWQ